jgi:hypothetical protein
MFCYDTSMGLSQCLQLKLRDHPQETPYQPHHENDPASEGRLLQNELYSTRERNEEKHLGCDCHNWNCASRALLENGPHTKHLLVRLLGQFRMAVFGWFFCVQLSNHTQ